ncbi:MAG: hypothetical protein FWE09_04120 [Treponema sp.]|nr:hypothetical protein [Treponema sp.]
MKPTNSVVIENIRQKAIQKSRIYEWHCYNYLLEEYSHIDLVKSKYLIDDHKTYDGFKYTSFGNISYVIGKSIFCEFDAIGMKGKDIFLFEVSRGKSPIFRNRILRKVNLCKILFPGYVITLCYMIPRDSERYSHEYNALIIPEPNYENFFRGEKYIFSKKIRDCITLDEFCKKINGHSLIKEIILASEIFYNEGSIPKLQDYGDLIDKLYDTRNILSDKFNCYDLLAMQGKTVRCKNDKYYIDAEKLCEIDMAIIGEIKHKLTTG